MGWDITYHPVGRDEIRSVYFATLADPALETGLAERFGVDAFDADKMRAVFASARELPPDRPFNQGHAFHAAIVSGFLRRFHYVRGGAYSFLLDDPVMAGYVSDWIDLVPPAERHHTFENQLTENYCAGVYLDSAALQRLRTDARTEAHVQAKMEAQFSHGRLAVFWKAVDAAIAQGLGLLEATEVIEPNPMDLGASTGYSNVLNCETDGLLLYADAAREQLAQAQKQFAQADRTRKGLFARLLGRK